MRCEKAKLVCQGYDKASVFVNRTLTKPTTTALAAISEARLNERKPICPPPSKLYQSFQRLRNSISDPSCSPLESRTQAWEILKELYLPSATTTKLTDSEVPSSYAWLQAACQLGLRSCALDQALLAFCAIQICMAEPWSISVATSIQVYNEALPKLVQNLKLPRDQVKDETLAAIVVLSTCEVRTVNFRNSLMKLTTMT